jgi:dihydrofolate reductase
MNVYIIAAVAANGVIGNKGGIPWCKPCDLSVFRRRTLGCALIVGRATAETLPRLPGRTVLAVSRAPGGRSIQGALDEAQGLGLDVWIAGGAEVYADALSGSYASHLVLTRLRESFEGDTWFPPIPPHWVLDCEAGACEGRREGCEPGCAGLISEWYRNPRCEAP